mgnify:CR=1 FL=1
MKDVINRKIETERFERANAVGKKIGVRTKRLSVVIYCFNEFKATKTKIWEKTFSSK